MTDAEILVIGGGIAGASAAFELAAHRKTILVERESFCGYHSTGRSAASFTENYGNTVIRRLARASRDFFERPPTGFAEAPLVTLRGMLTIGRTDQRAALDAELARGREYVPDMYAVDADDAVRRVPILRRNYVAGGVVEPRSLDIDVHGVHQAFLKGFKARGGSIATDAEVTSLERNQGNWRVQTRVGSFTSKIIVNAAGAWADHIAALADARPVRLTPKRRTAFTVDAPVCIDVSGWPLVNDVAEQFYFKPDAGQLLVSPADATPSAPVDARPEELDIAIGVDRLERATTLKIAHIKHKWAGLRSFVADNSPVVGWDDEVQGFFWVAGQGGYGIKTSPALARAVASLVEHGRLTADMRDAGLRKEDLAPGRCRVRPQSAPATI
jgi:D-arginine dehydrogenase